MTVELTCQAQIRPGWKVQPNFQYVMHPGGHVPYPDDPTGLSPIRNATIVGVRSIIQY